MTTKEATECPPQSLNSEDILFLLHTSSSTGKPKGVIHTRTGYLLYASLAHEVCPSVCACVSRCVCVTLAPARSEITRGGWWCSSVWPVCGGVRDEWCVSFVSLSLTGTVLCSLQIIRQQEMSEVLRTSTHNTCTVSRL